LVGGDDGVEMESVMMGLPNMSSGGGGGGIVTVLNSIVIHTFLPLLSRGGLVVILRTLKDRDHKKQGEGAVMLVRLMVEVMVIGGL
jgi:hypothetical protein